MIKSTISGMNRQIISLKFTQMSRIYLSIYLSIDLSIRPRGHSHCKYLFADRATRCSENSHSARTPEFLFRSRNSLKYGENLIVLPILTNFI